MDTRSGCVVIFVVWVISIPLDALALSLSWNWFVVPFLNLPTLGMGAAVGIRIFLSAIIRPAPVNERDAEGKSMGELVAIGASGAIGYPLLTIAIAFGWHLIMG